MKFPKFLKVYGDTSYRGPCPTEGAEQVTAINEIRKTEFERLVIHPKNEGKRTHGQVQWDKANGMTTGASDIIIPASPSFVCEIKRRDHTKSKWQDGQIEYLEAAHKFGAFACVALGHEGVALAFKEWQTKFTHTETQ